MASPAPTDAVTGLLGEPSADSEAADAGLPLEELPPEDEGRIYEDAEWLYWKDNNVPLLYDWFSHRNLEWPSSSSLWGPVLKTYAGHMTQRLYYSERCGKAQACEPCLFTIEHMGMGVRRWDFFFNIFFGESLPIEDAAELAVWYNGACVCLQDGRD